MQEIKSQEDSKQTPTLSRASTQSSEEAGSQLLIRASEAAARGLISDKEPPAPTTCQFCGRTLEHMGMFLPFVPGKIILWSPFPERCTCPDAVAFWEQQDREAAEREAAEKRRADQAAIQEKVTRLIQNSGMKGRFQQRTFDRWELTEENRRAFGICRRYADSFHIMQPKKDADGRALPPEKERNGLFLVGGYGTGKTHLAAAIANQLLQSGTAVICMTMIDLLARIKETYDRDGTASEAQVLRLYTEIPLLIIDDLGSEQPTEWGSTMIFSIINARYEAYMPTVVTSNCGADELVQRLTPRGATDRNAQKTVDRLREMCVAVQMDWDSWRSK